MILAQSIESDTSFYAPKSSDLDKGSNNLIKFGSFGAYTVGAFSLYEFWYKDFEQESFHFFDDFGEWSNVDKMGHIHASYSQSNIIYKGYKWSGQSEDKAILWSSVTSLAFQSAIDVMDGFSSGWGFSISDYSANLIGVSVFAIQQKIWHEQKVNLKMSYWPENYPVTPVLQSTSISINDRARSLFGTTLPEQFLKDYNAQTYWLSFHPALIFPNLEMPKWLNLAIGYGADNMLGGFENRWIENNEVISINNELRQRQFIFALDYNLTKINTKSKFLRTVLDVLNAFKWPSPGIELTSKGEFKFHLLFLN